MEKDAQPDFRAIGRNFSILGDFRSAEPFGSGHINDTYRVAYDQAGVPMRYVFQRINRSIFKDPHALMQNVRRVTAHLAAKVADGPDAGRRTLTLVPTRSGGWFHEEAAGECWRVYVFIERTRTFDLFESPQQAFKAARAFGEFQSLLADLPAPRLNVTIQDFHNTPMRFAAFEAAVAADSAGRAQAARAEIDFALRRRGLCGVLLEANLPERVTHNDTKFNNVLLDDATGDGVCVIDLDTVMPGLALYDFGDMVRSGANAAGEDDRDLTKVAVNFPMFEEITRGYLSAAGAFLTKRERQFLVVAAQLITFELGIRFLTDFLSGDTYFKVHREGHNLDRCRVQFKLVESMIQQEDRMQKLVEGLQ
jgi:Ser/Thr protein kinase RdoA (MazF antagonist)